MDEYIVKAEDMQAVADAIRTKAGTTAALEFPDGFTEAIESIPTGVTVTGGVEEECKATERIEKGAIVKFASEYAKREEMSYLNVRACEYSPDGTKFALAYSNAWDYGHTCFAVYDATTSPYSKIESPSHSLYPDARGCTFSPDGKYLAVANLLAVYDVTTTPFTKMSLTSPTVVGQGYHYAFSPDGTRLALAHNMTPFISIWDTTTTPWTAIANPDVLPTHEADWCGFSPDGTHLAVTHGGSAKVYVYDTTTTPYTKLPDMDFSTTYGSYCAAYSPDGTKFVVGLQSRVHVFDTATTPYTEIKGIEIGDQYWKSTVPQSIVFSPDSSRFIIAQNDDPFISIYDAATYTRMAVPSHLPDGFAMDTAFSPDGTKLAIAMLHKPGVMIFNASKNEYQPVSNGNNAISADTKYGIALEDIAANSTGKILTVLS